MEQQINVKNKTQEASTPKRQKIQAKIQNHIPQASKEISKEKHQYLTVELNWIFGSSNTTYNNINWYTR